MIDSQAPKWAAKHDVYRSTTDFTDLLKIVACNYEMYSKAATFVGPWIAKQLSGIIFLPPDKETLEKALGKDRPALSSRTKSAFIDALINHMLKHRGRKTLITPNPSSHHSAQFPFGTFRIDKHTDAPPALRDDRGPRKIANPSGLYKITFEGSQQPVFVENLYLPLDKIRFVIVRPKLGKLGMPSVTRWEVLFYTQQYGYLIDHTDSDLNPRYSGII